jgi:YHS domain-containing protein
MTRAHTLALLAVGALLPSLGEAEEFENTCAYALAERGVEVKTNCSVSWKNPATGKTYCFSTEQTKQLFLQDPEENIRKAEDIFAKLRKKQ